MLQREKDHIAGFAPEVAWVTHGGSEKLAERLCIRPTSEVLFCDYFRDNVHSYRDLPKLYNQWANIVRWEKSTRPFLRTTEFFWQEGHTLHETEAEARAEVLNILNNVYADFAENELAMPVIKGQKTESEKFAGAVDTYCIEAMMADGKALQAGTSHYLGTGFTRAFDISFTGRDGREANPHYTSWGVSTRLIGGIIMVHGDDRGMVMPPRVAPTQVVIVPIQMNKTGVLDAANGLAASLKKIARTHIDVTDNTPGWKYSEWEMKGVPLRIEIGPRDIENGTVVVVRRDNGEKAVVKQSDLGTEIPKMLDAVHNGLYERAKNRMESMIFPVKTYKEMLDIAENKPGFIRAEWCGAGACEDKLKKDSGVTSRAIIDGGTDKCAICGAKAKHLVIWGKSY